jgi:hypothetical protein
MVPRRRGGTGRTYLRNGGNDRRERRRERRIEREE